MDIRAISVATALWMFIFRKVPSWPWFPFVYARYPMLIRRLWDGWTEGAFCGGFWVALLLRSSTGLHTIHFDSNTASIIQWPLDGLTTAIGVLFWIRILDALRAVV